MNALTRQPSKRPTRGDAVRVARQVDALPADAAAIASATPWVEELPVGAFLAALKMCAIDSTKLVFVQSGSSYEVHGDVAERFARELLLPVLHCMCMGEPVAVVRVASEFLDAVALHARRKGYTVVVMSRIGGVDGEPSLAVTHYQRPIVIAGKREAEVEAIVESLPGFLRDVCCDMLRVDKSDRVRCSVVTRKFLTKYRRAGAGHEDSCGTDTVLAILDAMRFVPQGSQWRLPDVIRRYGEYVRKSGHNAADEQGDSECDSIDTDLRLIKFDNCEPIGPVRPGA